MCLGSRAEWVTSSRMLLEVTRLAELPTSSIALQPVRMASGHTIHRRRCAEPHERPRDFGSDAAATNHGRTPLRNAQVPHLRPSAPAVARPDRRSDGNEYRHHGLQPQTDRQHPRSNPSHPGTHIRLRSNHSSVERPTNAPQRKSPRHLKTSRPKMSSVTTSFAPFGMCPD